METGSMSEQRERDSNRKTIARMSGVSTSSECARNIDHTRQCTCIQRSAHTRGGTMRAHMVDDDVYAHTRTLYHKYDLVT